MSTEQWKEQRVDCCDGKYTVIHSCGMNLRALRYGKPWDRDLVGDGLVLALAMDLAEAREIALAKRGDPADLEFRLQQAQAALAARTKDYYDVADAVCRESTGAQDVCRQARETRAALAAVTLERDELQSTFDLRWAADMRAIKRWQEAHPEKPLTWPDHADLCIWLSEQLADCQSREAKVLEERDDWKKKHWAAHDDSQRIFKLWSDRAFAAEADRNQLQAQVGALNWSSIDSAPTDGTLFIGFNGKRVAPTKQGQLYVKWPHDEGGPTFRAVWNEIQPGWMAPWEPTHWMPMPTLAALAQPPAAPDSAKEENNHRTPRIGGYGQRQPTP